MTAGLPLAVAAMAFTTGVLAGRGWPRVWLALMLAGAVAALGAGLVALVGAGPAWEWRSAFAVGGEFLHLRLDAVSGWFLIVLGVVAGAGGAYAHGYWPDRRYPESAPRGRMWWSALALSMGWVLVASNGLHFLLGWELFTVSAFFLITLERSRAEVRRAGWLFLAASHAGTVCLFAFFATLAAKTGSWDLGPGTVDDARLAPLFWLVLAGFGVKTGLFPLHVWLPSAHANAPSHVSAILSGVSLKMGVYGIVRFSGWVPVPAAAGWVVLGLGATGALLGIAFALAQTDLKRLLAYSSVENVGIVMTGVGGALLGAAQGDPAGAAWGRLALAGALLHVWNHAAFKSLLFFGAGSVLHATGTREMSRLGGLWRTMPWTAGLFALGAVAVAGLPPLNGFASEWLLYLGLFDATLARGATAWATMLAAIVLATAGALALATFVKASAVVFLGAPRTTIATRAHDCGVAMRVPMIGLAAICATLGMAPALAGGALARVIGVWRPAWAAVGGDAPLIALGGVAALVAAAGAAVAFWLWRKARNGAARRAPTWDCGYAAPSSRMQYTAGSFGGLGAGWFGWALQPERTLRRPRGVLPVAALHLERVPEAVLERAIAPLGALVLRISFAARRLQHGRLQAYVVYLLAGLAALGLLVIWGGAS